MYAHRGRRRLLALAIGLVAVSAQPVPAGAATTAVDEVGTSYQPAEIRIAVNDRVAWTNRSSQSHTVTFVGGPGDLHPNCDPAALGLLRTGCQTPGSTVEAIFTRAGTYPYYCKIHANAPTPMRGAVIVSATTTTTSSTSSSSRSSSTTTTSQRATSSTTTTTRPLATSSTVGRSTTTTTSQATSVLLPGEPPSVSGDDGANAASRSDGSGDDSRTVALIVALLAAVSLGGGYLVWRLRPGRP